MRDVELILNQAWCDCMDGKRGKRLFKLIQINCYFWDENIFLWKITTYENWNRCLTSSDDYTF